MDIIILIVCNDSQDIYVFHHSGGSGLLQYNKEHLNMFIFIDQM